ncbi:hypothetical protein QYE76_047513 [Lolium multiflorum]|uniref:CCHC-type domain-containing protein n=1 Tax=Lolium multiflorum TaxID=4521 RepID=A0AAD8TQ19_LOLMU|nr:hypothetical protein QYE76_047513 [Lolium multiflorum]
MAPPTRNANQDAMMQMLEMMIADQEAERAERQANIAALQQIAQNNTGHGNHDHPGSKLKNFQNTNPPIFSKTEEPLDADEWLQTMENNLEVAGVEATKKVLFATHYLSRPARAWWTSARAMNAGQMMTWEDFKMKFSKYHVPQGLIKMMRDEFRELKQGRMSVVEYRDRFLTLSRYAPDETDSNEKRKERFLNGLHDEMQTVLVNIPFVDLEALVDSAIQMEGKLHQANENRKRRMMNQHGSRNTQKTPETRRQQQQHHTSNNNPNNNNNGNNNNNNNNTGPRTGSNAIPVANKDKATITCYECGVVGHYSNECPKRLAKIAANTDAPAQNQHRFAARRNQNNNNGRLYNMTATEAKEAPQAMPKPSKSCLASSLPEGGEVEERAIVTDDNQDAPSFVNEPVDSQKSAGSSEKEAASEGTASAQSPPPAVSPRNKRKRNDVEDSGTSKAEEVVPSRQKAIYDPYLESLISSDDEEKYQLLMWLLERPMIKELIRIGAQFIGYREYASKTEEKLAEANKLVDTLAQKLEQSETARKKAELDASQAKAEADKAKAEAAGVEDLQKRLDDAETALNEHKAAQATREKAIIKRLNTQNRRFLGKTNQEFELEDPDNDPLLDALSFLEFHGTEVREGIEQADAGLSRLFPYFFPNKEEPKTFLALAKDFNPPEDLGLKMRQENMKIAVESTVALVANSQQTIDWEKVGDTDQIEQTKWRSLIKAAKPNTKKILAYLGIKPSSTPSSSRPEV